MKRIFTLTLALLMAVMLFSVAGARNYTFAEEVEPPENPYVGLWEITGTQYATSYIPSADTGTKYYMDFLPNGVIYGVITNGDQAVEQYLAYAITDENALTIYVNGTAAPGEYDPETDTITMTVPTYGQMSFLERVKDDPLPDIRALVDHSQQEVKYLGYQMTQSGQTMSILEIMPAMGMDVHDVYLTLNPDGTGYLQFGDAESGDEITWNGVEFTADGESRPYYHQGDHIVLDLTGDGQMTVEFAPAGEVEALLLLMNGDDTAFDGEVKPEDLVGEWKLAKATSAGQTLSPEEVKEKGMDMSFTFNADGSAAMANSGSTIDGLNWTLNGNKITLSVYSSELPFDLSYNGEYVILNYVAKLYFEKVE